MLQGEVRLLEQERARLTREVKLTTELEVSFTCHTENKNH